MYYYNLRSKTILLFPHFTFFFLFAQVFTLYFAYESPITTHPLDISDDKNTIILTNSAIRQNWIESLETQANNSSLGRRAAEQTFTDLPLTYSGGHWKITYGNSNNGS